MRQLEATGFWLFPRGLRLAGVLLAGFLAGCAINPPLELSALSGDRSQVQLASVPFYPQEDFECGPAALAGILGASGLDIRPDALSPQVYLPGRQGSLQLELLAATRRAGRIPYLTESDPAALLAQLNAARPVLVLQNLRTRGFPAWHYSVMVGFDAVANRVYLNSGRERAMPVPAPSFLRTWDWAGRWALVALRPGDLPAQADVARYAGAVASFEAVAGLDAAQPAWRAALLKWPEDSRAYLALGNAAYGRDDLLVAADYYRRGLAFDAQAPALANNLASVLGELGCPGAGVELLRPVQAALADDSAWRGIITATLEELGGAGSGSGVFCAALK